MAQDIWAGTIGIERVDEFNQNSTQNCLSFGAFAPAHLALRSYDRISHQVQLCGSHLLHLITDPCASQQTFGNVNGQASKGRFSVCRVPLLLSIQFAKELLNCLPQLLLGDERHVIVAGVL